ncbi:hypothetical protein RND81_10G091600 [Saponaria officinalis]|uniref:RNase H type-1 domain-containing protein n=1 Tax=Saponaria officinalis TaxID=3572 RepID=A0AAW1I2F5_SAPOF
MDLIKYLFEKPVLNGRMARWTLLLAEFDIKYIPLKAIKGQAVFDFLADNAILERPTTHTTTLPDIGILNIVNEYWELYFDGASNYRGCGVGILLISPSGDHTPLSIKLDFDVTNNAAEYKACLYGLQAALVLKIQNLMVYGDSSLIINQDNQFADALAKLSPLVNIPPYMDTLSVVVERRSEPAYINTITSDDEENQEPWYRSIINFKTTGEYPPNIEKRGKGALRHLASQFVLEMGQLLKKTPQGTLLMCVNHKKGQE